MAGRALRSFGWVLVLLAAGCEGDQLGVLTPEAEFDPASLDFGSVSLGSQARLPVQLKNTGPLDLTIQGVLLESAEVLDFGIELAQGEKSGPLGAGDQVAAGATLDLEVTFTPMAIGPRQTRMMVATPNLSIPITVSGRGTPALTPTLTAEPNPVDFGRIFIGGQTTALVTISNAGSAPAVLDAVSYASTGTPQSGGNTFVLETPLPITVLQDESVQIILRFSADTEGQFIDTLTFNPGAATELAVDLSGSAAPPQGDFSCEPSPVEFGQVERGQSPTLRIRCTLLGGAANVTGANIATGDAFVLRTMVVPNRLLENQALEMDVQFNAEGLPRFVQGQLLLQYTNDIGPSVTRVILRGQVIPPQLDDTAISVRLDWDTDQTDLDLHFVSQGGAVFDDTLDCYFSNPEPDWGTLMDQTDNPFLDDDDTNGFGPENINLSRAGPGDYDVYVHYWSDRGLGPSNAQLEIFLEGQSVYTGSQRMACTELWHVGTVTWDGFTGSFSPVGTVDPVREGRCL